MKNFMIFFLCGSLFLSVLTRQNKLKEKDKEVDLLEKTIDTLKERNVNLQLNLNTCDYNFGICKQLYKAGCRKI